MTDELRDIILNDHFGGAMSAQIVDQWVGALEPGSQVPLPPNIKGFYGGSLRSSMPIEVARGSYKYITHETQDKAKIAQYARRMLVSLSLIDIPELAADEPTLAALALWHRALAQVRLPGEAPALRETLLQYLEIRKQSNLPDSKLPEPDRLAGSLTGVASSLGNEQALNSIGVLRDRREATSPVKPL